MKTLLHLLASPREETLSHSRRAAQAALARLRATHPGTVVVGRDLAREPVPHPDPAFVQASLMPAAERGPAHHAALALSEKLIEEFDAADFVLISTPMHNFTVPSVLKAWIDQVVRPRRTFGFTPTGSKGGLLRDRPVRVLMACGGTLGSDPGDQADFATPYLRYVFKTIGITDLRVLALQRSSRGGGFDAERVEAWLEETS